MNANQHGLPGDLHEDISREIKAHIPNIDWSRARLLTECIVRVFIRHYEAEANEPDANQTLV